jgi:predicted esterase
MFFYVLFIALSCLLPSPITTHPQIFSLDNNTTLAKYICQDAPLNQDNSVIITLSAQEEAVFKKGCAQELKICQLPAVAKLKELLLHGPLKGGQLIFEFSNPKELVKFKFIPKKDVKSWHYIEITGSWQKCPPWIMSLNTNAIASVDQKQSSKSWPAKMLLTLGAGYALSRWHISQSTGEKELSLPAGNDLNFWFDQYPSAQGVVFFAHGYYQNFTMNHDRAMCHYQCFSPIFETNRPTNQRDCAFMPYTPVFKHQRRYISFAQRWDVFQIKDHLQALIATNETRDKKLPIVCLGSSNGASSLLATLCTYPEIANQISAVILQAPYADIGKFDLSRFSSLANYFPHSDAVVKRLIQSVVAPNYSCSKPSPLELATASATNLPDQLPIIFLHAQDDEVIPLEHSQLLHDALKAAGKNSHLFTVAKGGHSMYLQTGGTKTTTYGHSYQFPSDIKHVEVVTEIKKLLSEALGFQVPAIE